MKNKALLRFFMLFTFQISVICQISGENDKIDSLTKLLHNENHDTTKIKLLIDLSSAYYQNDLKLAMKYAEDARLLSEKANYQVGLVKSYIELTKNCILLYKLDSALLFSSRAFDIASHHKMTEYAAIAARYQGTTLKHAEKYSEALASFQISESLAIQSNDSSLLGTLYREIGNVYINKGLYETSLKYLLLSHEIRLKSKTHVAATLSDLGFVNMQLKHYDKALDYHKQVLDFYLKKGDLHAIAYAYSDMGLVYAEIKDYDKALDCHKNSLQAALQAQHYLSAGIANINMAEIYGEIKNYDDAINNVEQAFHNFTLGGNFPQGEFMANTVLANIYLKMNRPDLAEQILPKAEIYRQSVTDANANLSFLMMAANVYEARKDWQKAFEYYKEYNNLSDSINKLNNFRQIEDIQTKYETEKKEIENEALKKDNAAKNSLIKRQYIISFSTAAIAFLCLSLALVFFRFQKKQKTVNLMLAMQNEEILTQAEELQDKNEELIRLNYFKESMTGMIVHDLKNPLNTIIGLVNDPVVISAALKMLTMVQNILDIQKFEDAKMKLNISDVEANSLVFTAVGDVKVLYESKGILIENSIPGSLFLKVDFELIIRVFVNLLTNAIKFSPNSGKITLSAETSEKNTPSGFVKIQVADNGQGIPTDQIEELFNRYNQITVRSSGISGSTGLGLAFCKMAVEAHGGQIGVNSLPGQGATFWFSLPKGNNITENAEIEDNFYSQSLNIEQNDLLPHHIEYLKPFCNQLKDYEVFEYSNIKKVLEAITNDDLYVQNWKNQLRNALKSCNEELFQTIIKL